MSKMLSKYLSIQEYQCKCCGALPPDLYDEDALAATYAMFFDAFDVIREAWGSPILINSGYRCIDHNVAVGGEPNSVHTFGLALDLECVSAQSVDQLAQIIERIEPDLRRGEYKTKETFIHIDAAYWIWPKASLLWKPGIRWNK